MVVKPKMFALFLRELNPAETKIVVRTLLGFCVAIVMLSCEQPASDCASSEACPKAKPVCLQNRCVAACPGFEPGQTCCNGLIEADEQCDNGLQNSDEEPDACRNDCRLASCGDGVIDSGELCDLGAENGDHEGASCGADCVPTTCGNNQVDAYEECDDGNNAAGDGCDPSCRVEVAPAQCGNGVVEEDEACDAGTANSDSAADTCRTDCTAYRCGDGVIDSNELCDAGAANDDANCSAQCTLLSCGNGTTEAPEECDDGNSSNNDGCLSTCVQASCGDGYLWNSDGGSESCDGSGSGSGGETTSCNVDCTSSTCGDGIENTTAGESCDDGNTDDCSGECSGDCSKIISGCGDGITCGDEICDDGNTENCEGTCSGDCSQVIDGCGDGITCGDEVCDDGNTDNCEGTCNVDCTKAVTGCGDGILCGDEICDDGNTENCEGTCSGDCSAVLDGCGDGITCGDEVCDDGNTENCEGTCFGDCTKAVTGCGDGILCGDEICDDGDDNDDQQANACRTNCEPASCGDSVTDSGEACDLGSLVNGLSLSLCTGLCQIQARCGDGIVQASNGEACDNGSSNSLSLADACRINCREAFCGDGVTDSAEDCDDGNIENGDGCDNNCTFTACGNGELSLGEECDDGNINDDDGCDSNCTVHRCGNGIKNMDEQCDDGNWIETDSCLHMCFSAVCGDGVVRTDIADPEDALFEECDGGIMNNSNVLPDACREDCKNPYCGDMVIDSNESCDMGEQNGLGGCTIYCTDKSGGCGDGTVTAPEQCDDGMGGNSDTAADACRTDCMRARCGDGVVDTGEGCDEGLSNGLSPTCNDSCYNPTLCGNGALDIGEECDEGNVGEGDPPDNSDTAVNGCRTDCRLAPCGDGVIDFGQECDDGSNDNTDDCLNNCHIARCGDGVRRLDISDPDADGFEECDDGNETDDGSDTCYSNCSIFMCGNGVVDAPREDCDDGNDVDPNGANGDTCYSTCVSAVANNGITDSGEDCDDGNASNNDGCLVSNKNNVCGDGHLNIGVEVCDDGNTVDTDACTNACELATCGDGITRTDIVYPWPGSEACDDGNDSNTDACVLTPGGFGGCSVAMCGDGYTHEGVEDCDEESSSWIGTCLPNCAFATCGDGFGCNAADCTSGPGGGPEQCDNGENNDDGGLCTTTCAVASCGDGLTNYTEHNGGFIHEECDDDNSNQNDACLDTCKWNVCGDGFLREDLEPGSPGYEECDEGPDNNNQIGLCKTDCAWHECGDGVWTTPYAKGSWDPCMTDTDCANNEQCQRMVAYAYSGYQEEGICVHQLHEQCEDGNTDDTDACTSDCRSNYCGDEHVCTGEGCDTYWQPYQECDDGNGNDNDSCTNLCVAASCGDGITCSDEECNTGPDDGPEQCDDGNSSETDGCLNDCTLAVCGDGYLRGSSEPGSMQICEDNSDCPEGETCRGQRCYLEAYEECDDGNANDTDTCFECLVNYSCQGYPTDKTSPWYWSPDLDEGEMEIIEEHCAFGLRAPSASDWQEGYDKANQLAQDLGGSLSVEEDNLDIPSDGTLSFEHPNLAFLHDAPKGMTYLQYLFMGWRTSTPFWGMVLDEDDRTSSFEPQGITGSCDAYASCATQDGYQYMIVGSYYDGRSRISILDITDSNVDYVKVLLVDNLQEEGNSITYDDHNSHVGGLVWYGPYLFAPKTYSGLKVFDLRYILKVPGGYEGYDYILPEITHYHKYDSPEICDTEADEDGDGIGGCEDPDCDCSGAPETIQLSNELKFSFLGLDRSTTPHQLVVGEYYGAASTYIGCLSLKCWHGKAVHFNLNPQTYLPDAKRSYYSAGFYIGEVRGRKAVIMGQSDVQGIISRDGTYYMSSAGSADIIDIPDPPETDVGFIDAIVEIISGVFDLFSPIDYPNLYYGEPGDDTESESTAWPLFPEDLYDMRNNYYRIWTPTELFCGSSEGWCTRGNIIGIPYPDDD